MLVAFYTSQCRIMRAVTSSEMYCHWMIIVFSNSSYCHSISLTNITVCVYIIGLLKSQTCVCLQRYNFVFAFGINSFVSFVFVNTQCFCVFCEASQRRAMSKNTLQTNASRLAAYRILSFNHIFKSWLATAFFWILKKILRDHRLSCLFPWLSLPNTIQLDPCV